jgi:hypothetical protein
VIPLGRILKKVLSTSLSLQDDARLDELKFASWAPVKELTQFSTSLPPEKTTHITSVLRLIFGFDQPLTLLKVEGFNTQIRNKNPYSVSSADLKAITDIIKTTATQILATQPHAKVSELYIRLLSEDHDRSRGQGRCFSPANTLLKSLYNRALHPEDAGNIHTYTADFNPFNSAYSILSERFEVCKSSHRLEIFYGNLFDPSDYCFDACYETLTRGKILPEMGWKSVATRYHSQLDINQMDDFNSGIELLFDVFNHTALAQYLDYSTVTPVDFNTEATQTKLADLAKDEGFLKSGFGSFTTFSGFLLKSSFFSELIAKFHPEIATDADKARFAIHVAHLIAGDHKDQYDIPREERKRLLSNLKQQWKTPLDEELQRLADKKYLLPPTVGLTDQEKQIWINIGRAREIQYEIFPGHIMLAHGESNRIWAYSVILKEIAKALFPIQTDLHKVLRLYLGTSGHASKLSVKDIIAAGNQFNHYHHRDYILCGSLEKGDIEGETESWISYLRVNKNQSRLQEILNKFEPGLKSLGIRSDEIRSILNLVEKLLKSDDLLRGIGTGLLVAIPPSVWEDRGYLSHSNSIACHDNSKSHVVGVNAPTLGSKRAMECDVTVCHITAGKLPSGRLLLHGPGEDFRIVLSWLDDSAKAAIKSGARHIAAKVREFANVDRQYDAVALNNVSTLLTKLDNLKAMLKFHPEYMSEMTQKEFKLILGTVNDHMAHYTTTLDTHHGFFEFNLHALNRWLSQLFQLGVEKKFIDSADPKGLARERMDKFSDALLLKLNDAPALLIDALIDIRYVNFKNNRARLFSIITTFIENSDYSEYLPKVFRWLTTWIMTQDDKTTFIKEVQDHYTQTTPKKWQERLVGIAKTNKTADPSPATILLKCAPEFLRYPDSTSPDARATILFLDDAIDRFSRLIIDTGMAGTLPDNTPYLTLKRFMDNLEDRQLFQKLHNHTVKCFKSMAESSRYNDTISFYFWNFPLHHFLTTAPTQDELTTLITTALTAPDRPITFYLDGIKRITPWLQTLGNAFGTRYDTLLTPRVKTDILTAAMPHDTEGELVRESTLITQLALPTSEFAITVQRWITMMCNTQKISQVLCQHPENLKTIVVHLWDQLPADTQHMIIDAWKKEILQFPQMSPQHFLDQFRLIPPFPVSLSDDDLSPVIDQILNTLTGLQEHSPSFLLELWTTHWDALTQFISNNDLEVIPFQSFRSSFLIKSVLLSTTELDDTLTLLPKDFQVPAPDASQVPDYVFRITTRYGNHVKELLDAKFKQVDWIPHTSIQKRYLLSTLAAYHTLVPQMPSVLISIGDSNIQTTELFASLIFDNPNRIIPGFRSHTFPEQLTEQDAQDIFTYFATWDLSYIFRSQFYFEYQLSQGKLSPTAIDALKKDTVTTLRALRHAMKTTTGLPREIKKQLKDVVYERFQKDPITFLTLSLISDTAELDSVNLLLQWLPKKWHLDRLSAWGLVLLTIAHEGYKLDFIRTINELSQAIFLPVKSSGELTLSSFNPRTETLQDTIIAPEAVTFALCFLLLLFAGKKGIHSLNSSYIRNLLLVTQLPTSFWYLFNYSPIETIKNYLDDTQEICMSLMSSSTTAEPPKNAMACLTEVSQFKDDISTAKHQFQHLFLIMTLLYFGVLLLPQIVGRLLKVFSQWKDLDRKASPKKLPITSMSRDLNRRGTRVEHVVDLDDISEDFKWSDDSWV